MKWWKLLLIVGLLALSGFVSTFAQEDDVDDLEDIIEDEEDYDEPERAHLIARKSIKEDLVVAGRNVTVMVDIYNAGRTTAQDVVVEDASVPEDINLLEGETSAKFDKITVGGRVSFSYVIVPTVGDKAVYLDPATVTYKAEPESAEIQVGKSTIAGFYVLTPVQQIQRYALTAGRYATLGMIKTPTEWRNLVVVVGSVVGLLGANSAYKYITTSSKDRKRKKALKDLEDEAKTQ